MWLLILPLLWTSYTAWLYALIPIDPDQGLFMVWGFTGAPYGKGFVDCKTPGIHLWYLMLTKIVGRNVKRVKFLHHFIIGATGSTIIYLVTDNFYMAMAWAILINSGWLFSFHGNVGALAALMILPAVLEVDPWIACSAMVLALFLEPKILPAALLLGVAQQWWIPGVAWVIILALFYMATRKEIIWEYIEESSLRIPLRISRGRRKYSYYPWVPYFTAQPLLYILPWVIPAVWSQTDLLYWLPLILVMVFQATGKVLRPNHFLLMVPWLALSPIPPSTVLVLFAIELVSSGFYLGDIWSRWAPELGPIAWDVMDAGEQIRERSGDLFATGMWASCIYVWAQKAPVFPLVTNIEVRETATERVAIIKDKWKQRPPELMVTTPKPFLKFQPRGYVSGGKSTHVNLWLRK